MQFEAHPAPGCYLHPHDHYQARPYVTGDTDTKSKSNKAIIFNIV